MSGSKRHGPGPGPVDEAGGAGGAGGAGEAGGAGGDRDFGDDALGRTAAPVAHPRTGAIRPEPGARPRNPADEVAHAIAPTAVPGAHPRTGAIRPEPGAGPGNPADEVVHALAPTAAPGNLPRTSGVGPDPGAHPLARTAAPGAVPWASGAVPDPSADLLPPAAPPGAGVVPGAVPGTSGAANDAAAGADLRELLGGIPPALVFLTRLPLPPLTYRPAAWAWATAHFPLVGALIGGITGLTFVLLAPLGPVGAALLALTAAILLTGALHEDGLADTADALGGASDRGRLFEILKDSRIGAYGSAALVLSIGVRAALLSRLDGFGLLPTATALAAVGALARLAPVLLIRALPHVSASTAKSCHVIHATTPQVAVASAWSAIAIAIAPLTWPRAPALVLALAAAAAVTGWRWHRRAGGVTGDLLGATEQITEIALLAVLAWQR